VTIHQIPNTLNLESFWMPFTANKAFKRAPRLLVSAEGMYYTTADGRRMLVIHGHQFDSSLSSARWPSMMGSQAYAIALRIEQWQRRAGHWQSRRTILCELKRGQSADVVRPTEDGRELRLRCVVRPEAAQAGLLDRLGLDLPQRLRVSPLNA